MTQIFKASEIFKKLKNGDTEMCIPKEIMEKAQLTIGDKVKIKVGDQGTMIINKVED